jgi:hypothetical protein
MTPDRLLLTLCVLASIVTLVCVGKINETVQQINQVVREAQ